MKKKLLFITAAAGLLALAACTREELRTSFWYEEPSPEKVSLTVRIEGGPSHTKAEIQSAEEAKVNTLQVFVFNGDNIDVYGKASDALSLTLDATVGERTVWALANAPDLGSVTSLAALKAEVSAFSDNAAGAFVMSGGEVVTLTASSSVTVPVSRIAARVVIRKITRKLSAAGLAALPEGDFSLVRAYLLDVPAEQRYDRTLTSFSAWASSSLGDGRIVTSNVLLCQAPTGTATIAQGGSYEWGTALYCYPNPTTEDGSAAKVTRLVLECSIDGSLYTYPVLLDGGVVSNRSYEIKELVITRLGNPSDGDDDIDPGEDQPVTSVDIPFGVSVSDWEVVLLGEGGTVSI